MSRGPACLLDSNVLLRVSRRTDPHYTDIRTALVSYRTRAVRLCYTSQILGEYWNVSTRPKDQNGFGLSIAETDVLAKEIENDFEFLADSQAIHDRWRSLLVKYEIKGVRVHDVRIAASMYVHDIAELLTINVRDFSRFEGLTVVHPADVK